MRNKEEQRLLNYICKKQQKTKQMKKPKCSICGKPMKNAVDSKTKKVSPYLWETTCEHMKGLILARG